MQSGSPANIERLTTNFVHDSTVRYFQMFLILCKFNIAVAHFYLTWVFSVMSLSIHAPRYLTNCDLHTVSPSLISSLVLHLLSCLLLPKIMNSSLELFISSLTESIHVLMLSKLLTNRSITYISSAGRFVFNSFTITWSSANSIRLKLGSNSLLMCCYTCWRGLSQIRILVVPRKWTLFFWIWFSYFIFIFLGAR